MRNRNIGLIFLIVALSVLYIWYEANKPQPVDWSETYSPLDKIPNGTYIANRSLAQLFPASRIITSHRTLMEEWELLEGETEGIYISVCRQFKPDPVEMHHLLEWCARGNTLFIAAENFVDTLLATFSLSYTYESNFIDSRLFYGGMDSVKYRFTSGLADYFLCGQAFKGKVLGGKGGPDRPDFVEIPYGKGQVLLNLHPKAFVNCRILDTVGGDYYYKAFSSMPDRGGVVFWDAYRTLSRAEQQTAWGVILRYPALRTALYLLVLGGILYLVFRARREQRAVPVIRAPRNRMLEFIAAVSALYYKKQENLTVALKLTDFFLGEVRARYYLSTTELDSQFVRLLAGRSGVESREVEKLVQLISGIRATRQVDQESLQALMRGIELFNF